MCNPACSGRSRRSNRTSTRRHLAAVVRKLLSHHRQGVRNVDRHSRLSLANLESTESVWSCDTATHFKLHILSVHQVLARNEGAPVPCRQRTIRRVLICNSSSGNAAPDFFP